MTKHKLWRKHKPNQNRDNRQKAMKHKWQKKRKLWRENKFVRYFLFVQTQVYTTYNWWQIQKFNRTQVVTKHKLWQHTKCDKHKLRWHSNCDETQIVKKHKLLVKHRFWWNTNCDETKVMRKYKFLWNTYANKTKTVINKKNETQIGTTHSLTKLNQETTALVQHLCERFPEMSKWTTKNLGWQKKLPSRADKYITYT